MQCPRTRAITGLPQARMARTASANAFKKRLPVSGVRSRISATSPPAQKARSPAPVRTTTPARLSWSARFTSSISDSRVWVRTALSTCGRFRVIRAMPLWDS